MALKTNYRDDGFTGNRKYRMVTNADNTVSFEDVTTYNPVGDSFGAADINNTNIAVTNLTTPTFEDYTSVAAPDPETALANIKSKAALTVLLSNIKAVLKGVIFKKQILANIDQVMANTVSGKLVDALAVKAVNQNLNKLKNNSLKILIKSSGTLKATLSTKSYGIDLTELVGVGTPISIVPLLTNHYSAPLNSVNFWIIDFILYYSAVKSADQGAGNNFDVSFKFIIFYY